MTNIILLFNNDESKLMLLCHAFTYTCIIHDIVHVYTVIKVHVYNNDHM